MPEQAQSGYGSEGWSDEVLRKWLEGKGWTGLDDIHAINRALAVEMYDPGRASTVRRDASKISQADYEWMMGGSDSTRNLLDKQGWTKRREGEITDLRNTLARQGNESEDEWVARVGKATAGKGYTAAAFGPAGPAAPGATATATAAAPGPAPTGTAATQSADEVAYRQMLNDFIKKMQSPLDDNDPEVQRYTAMATNASQRAAQASGVRGGMGVAATQRNVAAGMVPLTQFRQGQAAASMGMLGQNLDNAAQRQIQLQQLADSQNRFKQEQNMNMQQMRGAYDQSRGMSLGSLVGGGLGLLAGGLATYATGGAAAPAIPSFMQAGAGIGGSFGAANAGGLSNPYRWGNF